MKSSTAYRFLSGFVLAVVAVPVAMEFAPLFATPSDAPTVGGLPLFQDWPKDRKPDVVLVLTGQTQGYLSPCGCSRPQRGGLERRANFMQGLRDKGWPVVGLDLGDISPKRTVVEQDRLKYKTAMEALNAMGYSAVGLGKNEFELQLFDLLGDYALNKHQPVILAANLKGKDDTREKTFPRGPNQRPMIEAIEVIAKDPVSGAACLCVGVTGVIGRSHYEAITKLDAAFGFQDNGEALRAALAAMAVQPTKPSVNVLLYSGPLEEARKAAEAFPAFNLVVAQSEESEPPQFPVMLNDKNTMLVQVGHKGQNVGVVGVFKTATGVDLKYQLVPLGEEYLTPKEKVATNKVLGLLENYTKEVRDRNLIAKFTEKPLPHAAMVEHKDAKLTYVGSEKCGTCHPNEMKIWKEARHAHAYESLEKAVQPGLRQFDGECVKCHVTGFDYQGGFRNATDTPNLKHNGCENCHGPGSAHSADGKNKTYFKSLTPWRLNADDKLPAKAILEQLAKVKPGENPPVQLTPQQQRVISAVSSMCMKCHDGENDPHFNFREYMPKIWHSGFKAVEKAGLPDIAK